LETTAGRNVRRHNKEEEERKNSDKQQQQQHAKTKEYIQGKTNQSPLQN
jgi:hypothetical protein